MAIVVVVAAAAVGVACAASAVLFSPVPANLPAKGVVPAETTTIADPMRIGISKMFRVNSYGESSFQNKRRHQNRTKHEKSTRTKDNRVNG